MKVNHLLFVTVLLSSCVLSEDVKGPENPTLNDDFAYETIATSGIHIQLKTQDEDPLQKVKVQLWDKAPSEGGNVIYKAITDNNGSISADYNFPTTLEKAVLEISYIGMPNFLMIPVSDLNDGVVINGTDHEYETVDASNASSSQSAAGRMNTSGARTSELPNFQALGEYDKDGKPKYLEKRDKISKTLLEYINASLPEGQPVPQYHPSYLSDDTENNLNIIDEADVWMTFVHEGAGYRNVLGFYTYETGNPPNSVNDIETIHVAFPNASYDKEGGKLKSGDKVKLGRFEAGTSIGFVLLANGWQDKITGGHHQVFSHKHLNPEIEDDLKQHNVMLWDDENEVFLMGFEDLNRSTGSDDDFNDAIIYLSANPVQAISLENVNPVDKPIDADGDGVSDVYDEFPNDARYAYVYSYPGEDSYGSFAFEDQWPGFGDYDFNDLVVDYQYRQLANGTNQMVELESEFVIKAIGAGFQNGFGIELNISSSQISSVSGSELSNDLFVLDGNGTEAGQSKAVIPVSDNVHQSFGTNGFVNTLPDQPHLEPHTITVNTTFSSPVDLNDAGIAPFNPFLVINKTRGREVHLPGYTPTEKVDSAYFGEGNDASDPGNGIYYKSKEGLPWGMNLPESFDYPNEKTNIRDAYNNFDMWILSDGFSFMDWYQQKSGYRTASKIYNK
ncbi:LruC domain-containing protein [Ekhidna sp.]|uniref:LruC domain-containing protein n=1 Tax=Ekhidna sp. TaxID=2608089 RepID=UPI003CCB835F